MALKFLSFAIFAASTSCGKCYYILKNCILFCFALTCKQTNKSYLLRRCTSTFIKSFLKLMKQYLYYPLNRLLTVESCMCDTKKRYFLLLVVYETELLHVLPVAVTLFTHLVIFLIIYSEILFLERSTCQRLLIDCSARSVVFIFFDNVAALTSLVE